MLCVVRAHRSLIYIVISFDHIRAQIKYLIINIILNWIQVLYQKNSVFSAQISDVKRVMFFQFTYQSNDALIM